MFRIESKTRLIDRICCVVAVLLTLQQSGDCQDLFSGDPVLKLDKQFQLDPVDPNFGTFESFAQLSTLQGEFEFRDLQSQSGDSTQVASMPSPPQTSIGNIWWDTAVRQPLSGEHPAETVTVDSLLYAALRNSQQIQFLSKDPLIREQEITEADAEFDPAFFASSIYDDIVDPVGNDLTTLNDPFLEENIWSGEAGIRRKIRTGGEVEVFQQLGFQNSNSQFFNPQDQGTSTLGLNFNQPLLRGGGKLFNRGQILLAQTSTELAWEEFSAELQDELQRVVNAYWDLYFRRSVYLQIQRNVKRGEAILQKVEGRIGLDSLPSQVARAKSEVQTRRTELANAFRDVRNAETEIRRLVSDPNWLQQRNVEMIPEEIPSTDTVVSPIKNVVYTAIENRPEIKAVSQRARLAAIQTNILTNELLPELTFLFSSYVSALEGDTGIDRAFQQQFSSTPGFTVGLEFEVPYRNRAARSRHTRSRIQATRVLHEIRQTTQNVISEAQVAYNRVVSAVETLAAAELAVSAARLDLNQNHKRWENFALLEGDLTQGQTPTLVLDQLLDSQERLVNAEFTYSSAIRELKLSQIGLRRSTGTLLTVNNITAEKSVYDNQPTLNLASQGPEKQQPFLIDNSTVESPAVESPQSQQIAPQQIAPQQITPQQLAPQQLAPQQLAPQQLQPQQLQQQKFPQDLRFQQPQQFEQLHSQPFENQGPFPQTAPSPTASGPASSVSPPIQYANPFVQNTSNPLETVDNPLRLEQQQLPTDLRPPHSVVEANAGFTSELPPTSTNPAPTQSGFSYSDFYNRIAEQSGPDTSLPSQVR